MIMMLIASYAMSQTDSTTVSKHDTINNIAYITPNMDTLYVINEMYDTMVDVWTKPKYAKNIPIIIPVESIYGLKAE